MKKLLGITIVAICLASTSASAWTRYGGGWSCGMVTESKNNVAYETQFQAWSMGFISAVNDMTQTTLENAPDQYGVWQAIVLHCQNNPLDDLYTATANVLGEILRKQPN